MEDYARKWAKQRAWKARLGEAKSTGEGALESSGGTAVLATRTRGSAKEAERIAGKWQHRWHAAEVDLGLQLRVVVGSVYLEHSVGIEGNGELLEAISQQVKRRRLPWILGGDWNMDPCFLYEWARKIGGTIAASGEATCGGEEFDYFIVADELATMVKEVKVVNGLACSPHVPVGLTLKGVGKKAQVRIFSEPWEIDLDMPPPVRRPPEEKDDWKEQRAEEACKEWFTAAEDYLHELHELGTVKVRRAEGPKDYFVDLGTEWKKGLRKRASASTNCWAGRTAALVVLRGAKGRAGPKARRAEARAR